MADGHSAGIGTEIDVLGARTDLLLATVSRLDDGAVAEPSVLPGWTRGHVITHLARNAEAMCNLLAWARTGVRTPMYPSAEKRNADIEAGAGRPIDELRADLSATAAQLAQDIQDMPAEAWNRTIELMNGKELAVVDVPWHRLKEVEIHHADLGLDHTPGDWPAAFQDRLLDDVLATRENQPEAPSLHLGCTDTGQHREMRNPGPDDPLITGTHTEVLTWLLGRSPGASLTRQPAGALPELPPWV